MRVLADLSEEYSDRICHITTRQDVQLHYIHIEDSPRDLPPTGGCRDHHPRSLRQFRWIAKCHRLPAGGGFCHTEAFDVSPYAKAITWYLLGHPDTQDFGRKFKIAFSGCRDQACALVTIHDLGGIAVKRVIDGVEKRGFELYVGGGLGAVPYQAQLFDEFLPEEELLPMARAIGRVFVRDSARRRTATRRASSSLLPSLALTSSKRVVLEERRTMPEDPGWRKHFGSDSPVGRGSGHSRRSVERLP